jgi:hypothetical protein
MKLWIKILFISVVILVLIYGAAYIFLIFKGRALIIKQLTDITHRKVSIGYFDIALPLSIEMKNLDIEGMAKVEAISVSPSILGFITGNLALNEIRIIKPEFTYERTLPKTAESPAASADNAVSAAKPPKIGRLRMIIKKINIKEGRLEFLDRTVGENGLKITMSNVYFNLDNLYLLPRSVITNFEFKARVPWQEAGEEGKIEAEGWLNLFKKDMQATLKIEDIDGVALYPYYSKWVDLEKARIQKAKLNFTSDIQGLNNNVTANCHLELTDIVRRPLEGEESEEKAARIADAIMDIFKALNQGKIVLNFTIKTKMDRPEFGFSNIKMAFEEKLAQGTKSKGINIEDILVLPAKLLQGTVKSATDLSKAVIDGTVAVGREITKAVIIDPFKKEKKE